MPRGTRYTVLLIEADTSLRRLIALGLQNRGLQVIEANSLTVLADRPIANPDLLLLDIDNGWRDDASLLTTVQQHPYLATLPLVVLAWDQTQSNSDTTSLPLREYLAKPFDARTLHATIENLLETTAAIEPSERAIINQIPATVLVATSGLCPMITAAGLLLTVIGLMLQFMLAGVGLLVILIGLLWWTLGKRPENQILLDEINPQYFPSIP